MYITNTYTDEVSTYAGLILSVNIITFLNDIVICFKMANYTFRAIFKFLK